MAGAVRSKALAAGTGAGFVAGIGLAGGAVAATGGETTGGKTTGGKTGAGLAFGRSGVIVVEAMAGDSKGRGEGGRTAAAGEGAGLGLGAGVDADDPPASPLIRSTIPSSRLARVLFLTSRPHSWIRSSKSWLFSPSSLAN